MYHLGMQTDDCPKPTLYDDGACPVCAREVAMYRRQAGADGVCWVDVARCDTSELGLGLTRDAALARLHLRRPDGRSVRGAAAFTGLRCWGIGRFEWCHVAYEFEMSRNIPVIMSVFVMLSLT